MAIQMTFADAFSQWESDVKPAVVAQYGEDDTPALSESWNDYTDGLCKDGSFTDLQYNYCPAWDDEIPDQDGEFLLSAMGVGFVAAKITERRDELMHGMPAGTTHWTVIFTRSNKSFQQNYSQGPAFQSKPEIAAVFASILSDISSTQYAYNFEDWASNLGYDEDSRIAERTYRACLELAAKVSVLFSADEMSDLQTAFENY